MSTRWELDLSGADWRMWRDEAATWQDDKLYLPPVDVRVLPARLPTGGWSLLAQAGSPVDVPGTVEGRDWHAVGDYCGVSWWWRAFDLPAACAGRRIILQFASVRLRAEVFLNERLVGYDLMGETPFEVDVSDVACPGRNTLAVRITDPCGNFTWEDFICDRWGAYTVPPSHGFGGITGPVRVVVTDPVYIADLFVKNRPTPHEVELEITLANAGAAPVQPAVHVQITDAHGVAWEHGLGPQDVPPGGRTITLLASVPDARLWEPAQPHLYFCRVRLDAGDECAVRFGFRWFAPEQVGERAVLRLNGRRVVLRTAISWSFWPGSGLPTRVLAERQIRAAQQLGLNMLNFHRCIGSPLVLDLADELGLLYYEEPGGYVARNGDAFARAWAREKWLRMIRRDRNHPALVIYNMINECTEPPILEHERDLRDAAVLDPTRTITFTSGWNRDGADATKLHVRPYDPRQHITGWYDHHHATGPGVYCDEFYRGPDDYRLRTTNAPEIVYWGEEGAIATPPHLELIEHGLAERPHGWDGAAHRAWYAAYREAWERKGWRTAFPTLTDMVRSCGDVALYYHGRMLENVRLGNHTDGYAVNGWESEVQENHSGIVDCFRNIKGTPELLAYYNQPLYVAVKLRQKIAHAPARVVADFHIVNERDVRGPHQLQLCLEDGAGTAHWSATFDVCVSGGETYGELLVADVVVESACGPGRYFLRATLRQRGAEVATGVDELLLVDWRGDTVGAAGAVLGDGVAVRTFLAREKGVHLEDCAAAPVPLAYLVAEGFNPYPRAVLPAECLVPTAGARNGLTGTYYRGVDFAQPTLVRTDATLAFEWNSGPAWEIGRENFSVRWTGRLRAPESGTYLLHLSHDDGARLWLDDELLIDEWSVFDTWTVSRRLTQTTRPLTLAAGREYALRIDYFQQPGRGLVRLEWTTPGATRAAHEVARAALRRVREDGTTLVVLTHAAEWARLLSEDGLLAYHGWLQGGLYWLGSNYFVREHPIFADLPANQAFNWEYQELARYEADRTALLLAGEEAVVGMVTGHQHAVGTALGVVRCGRGQVILSTLDLLRRLDGPPGPADVTRKILCNLLGYRAVG